MFGRSLEESIALIKTDERLPDLNINAEYHSMVKESGLNKVDKDYVRGKIEAAKWL